MSEHSIAELQRQLREAHGLMKQAELSHIDAQRRLHAAMVQKTGLLGKRVKSGDAEILVHDVQFIRGDVWTVLGFQFRKDGTVGERERRFYYGSFTIVSPPPPTPSKAE